jgi:hypothetical protein
VQLQFRRQADQIIRRPRLFNGRCYFIGRVFAGGLPAWIIDFRGRFRTLPITIPIAGW